MNKKHSKYSRITTNTLSEMKKEGEKIAMLTSYDYTLASIIDKAGIDVILVGDSASNVMAGHETTVPITLDQMIYHASSVIRGVDRALVVVDLPFGTYQSDSKEALRSSIKIMKESGSHAIKLEGGIEVKNSIERILNAGIPVMGHLGLTPQSIEKIPAELAKKIASELKIPVIGIGAGVNVDGQVLVLHDMLGMNTEFSPRFLRRYLDLNHEITKAVGLYTQDVKKSAFPNDKEQY